MRHASLFILPAAILLAATAPKAQPAVVLPRASPAATVSQDLGYAKATVSYSRPSVKGRAIWGGLVPYGKVWRAGANEATTFEISQDARVGGKALPKGKYGLFIEPTEKEWTFIFSKQAQAWGSFAYDAKDDVLRVSAKPSAAPATERMEFVFEGLSDSGATLVLRWDRLQAGLPVVLDFLEQSKANIKAGLPKAKADDPYSWMNAAKFYWTYKVDRKQALEWIDKSIAVKAVHNNLWAKAEMLAEDGKLVEARAEGKKAQEAASKDPGAAGQAAILEAAMSKWPASSTTPAAPAVPSKKTK